MTEQLNSEEEDLLQSALSTAFSTASLPRQSVSIDSALETVAQQPTTAGPYSQTQEHTTADPGSANDVWKDEYEAHVAEWRRRSAEQRQKAEQTRAEWEAVREKERKEGILRQSDLSLSAHSVSEWEQLTASSAPADLPSATEVCGEGKDSRAEQPAVSDEAGTTPPDPPHVHERSASHPVSETTQEKWDSMTSSITSSFPSMSFPSDPHSPSSAPRTLPPAHAHSHHHHSASAHAHTHSDEHGHHPHRHEETRTATLSVFDSSLSPKTRSLALLSSVAINVLLPFVNGVMLGFGEIFAKNVVIQWLGWRVPQTASAASSKGSGRVALGRR